MQHDFSTAVFMSQSHSHTEHHPLANSPRHCPAVPPWKLYFFSGPSQIGLRYAVSERPPTSWNTFFCFLAMLSLWHLNPKDRAQISRTVAKVGLSAVTTCLGTEVWLLNCHSRAPVLIVPLNGPNEYKCLVISWASLLVLSPWQINSYGSPPCQFSRYKSLNSRSQAFVGPWCGSYTPFDLHWIDDFICWWEG